VASVTFDLYARGEQRVAHAFRVVRGEADKTEKSTRGLSKAWSGLSTAGGLAGKAAIGVAGVLVGGAAAAVAMTDSVIGLNLQVGKAKTVFGSSFAGVDRQLSKTASNFGITRIEALGLAGTFADMAKQTDFTTKQSASMSTKFVELAGRVKFLSAGQFDAAAASEALSAAFRGEYDSLQRVVPAISAARVEQVAADIQKKSSTKLTDDQAKMLAVLKIVQDGVGTSNALMATEEGKKALALERSRTKMRETWQELQTRLLPAFTELWEVVGGEVNPALEDFTKWISSPEGKRSMQDWVNLLGDGVHMLGEFARSIDDAIYWTKLLGIYIERTWKVGIPLAMREAQVAVLDMLAELPGVGDGFREQARRAHEALARLQRDTNSYDTESAQLEIGHLQGKINSLRGKTVKTEADKKAIDDSFRRIAELQRKIRGLTGRAVTITAQTVYYGDGSARRINPDGTLGRRMLARGGPVWGAGTETSDSIPASLSHNEHVVSAREVRGAGGHGALAAMRAQWRGAPGFAEGGAVGSPARVAAAIDMTISRFTHILADRLVKHIGGGGLRGFIQSNLGKPYIWGSAGPGGYDCSGWVSALVNTIRGQYPYRRLGTTGTFPWSGFAPGPGAFMVGSFRGNPGHMAATAFGLNTESTGSRGVIAGGNARGARSSLFGGNIWHLKGYASGGAVNGDAPYDLLDPNGAEYLGDAVRRAALAGRTFHQGGTAAGIGILLRGERVLTRSQNRSFENLVRVLDRRGGSGGGDVNVYVSGVVAGGERQVVELVSRAVKAARSSGHLHAADLR
jgi:hypothetical protein